MPVLLILLATLLAGPAAGADWELPPLPPPEEFWKGMEIIFDGFNKWTWISLGLVALTLLVAAVGVTPHAGGLDILINGKFFGVLLALVISGWLIKAKLTEDETRDFLWESWKFFKQIFPLLIVGVFVVGVIRALIRPEWIETLAEQNTLLGNLAGVVFGVFMSFPTLVEVPVAQMFLSLGMHRGPLLAYLMADPELSRQIILIISTIIGRVKSWTYVAWGGHRRRGPGCSVSHGPSVSAFGRRVNALRHATCDSALHFIRSAVPPGSSCNESRRVAPTAMPKTSTDPKRSKRTGRKPSLQRSAPGAMPARLPMDKTMANLSKLLARASSTRSTMRMPSFSRC